MDILKKRRKPPVTECVYAVNCDLTDEPLRRFPDMQGEGRRLIRNWLRHAKQAQVSENGGHFEAFIYGWIAFNAWASYVTGIEGDRQWLDRLSLEKSLQIKFGALVADQTSRLSRSAPAFREVWPIFKTHDLPDNVRGLRQDMPRGERVERYYAADAKTFVPECWRYHIEKGEPIPLDWPHTLQTLYRVRCNLFHGEKDMHTESDRTIVRVACYVLLDLIEEAELLRAGR